MRADDAPPEHEHHVLREEHPDDWAWRRAIRRRPTVLVVYRAVILIVGLGLVLGGLALVPLPGPGWLVVLAGLGVLASEFEPAARLVDHLRDRLRRWESWIKAQPIWVQGLLGAATLSAVVAAAWLTLWISGVPHWFPDSVEDLLVGRFGLTSITR